MGGLRITPDIALGLYEPGVAASWFKLYADRDRAGFCELMSA